MDEKEKKEYELAVLVPREEDLPSVVTLIRAHHGEMTMEPRAKKITLAYEIKKHKEAVFAHCTFTALGEDIKNLEKDLNTKAEVIRSLIIASPAAAELVDRERPAAFGAMAQRRPRTIRTTSGSETKPAAPAPLSNEALEKKIEEILQ